LPSAVRDATDRGSLARKFISFATIGAIATAVQYLVLIAGVELAGASATVASSLGFAVSALLNYWLNFHWTFAGASSHDTAAARFGVVAGSGFLINAGAMLALAKQPGLHYLAAQLLASGLTLAWSFSASHYWAFARPVRQDIR
jgi:putative flippase GtrA